MSYTVDGRVYHNSQEAAQARARLNAKRARQEADRARREATQIRSRMQQRERELSQARGDLARQTRINEAIRGDVQALGRVNQRLERAQTQLRSSMDAEFSSARAERQRIADETRRNIDRLRSEQRAHEAHTRRELSALNRTLDQTRADLSELDRQHQAHVAQVERTFREVRAEMDEGFAEAERRRAMTEQRLQAAIDEVDAKVMADRRARLAKETRQIDRARRTIELAEAELGRHREHQGALELEEEVHQVREKLSQARRLLDQGDEASGLAMASAADGEARALGYRATRRRAALEAEREDALARIASIQRVLDEEDTRRWFELECKAADRIVGRLLQEVRGGYTRHARREVEADRHQRLLARLEEQVAVMQVTAPILSDLSTNRLERAQKLLASIAHVYGPMRGAKQRFAVEGDRKSPLIVQCDFGVAAIDVHLEIDGEYQIEGYGHGSNGTCVTQGRAVIRALGDTSTVTGQQFDRDNRQEPALQDGRASESGWREVARRLEDLERGQ